MDDMKEKDLTRVSGGEIGDPRLPNRTSMSDEDYYAGVIEGNCPYCGKKFKRVNDGIGLWRQGIIGGDMWDPHAPQLYCCDSPDCQKKANDEERRRWEPVGRTKQ